MIIWGISANSHDAALTVVDGQDIVFASHSERFSGIKNDPHLNANLISYAARFGPPKAICWYEGPWLKSMRQLIAGQGYKFSENNIPNYLRKYDIYVADGQLGEVAHLLPTYYTSTHHKSHAAGGSSTCPFDEAAVVVIDAIGEFDCTSIWTYKNGELKKLKSIKYPDSLGLFYSAITQFIGLKPNEEEYILMGMAAYGKVTPSKLNETRSTFFKQTKFPYELKRNLHAGCEWWIPRMNKLDVAAVTQTLYEECFISLLQYAKQLTGMKNLILSGGCALNCVANTKAFNVFDDVWIMPNPGDAGSSLGAIAAVSGTKLNWQTPFLGYDIARLYDPDPILNELFTTQIVGVANGKAEFGPRALGNRSLFADPRGPDIKNRVNKIKQREQFRPFGAVILEEYASQYFEFNKRSPYMQYAVKCKYPEYFPAITHVDGTCRIQTVSRKDNYNLYELLTLWANKTGCPMLLNTSLNIKGKPLVNTWDDAQLFSSTYDVKVF